MKTRLFFTFLLICTAALFIFPSEILAQQKSGESGDFTIQVSIRKDIILLTCTEGCNWDTIQVKEGASTLDANGLVSTKDAGRASSFIIALQKNAHELSLQGIKGTAWSTLPLNCEGKCKLVFNENGLLQ